MEYDVNMTFKLAEDVSDENILECLNREGCTDALIGLGLHGYVGLYFIREADSAEAAAESALADVKRALPLAMLVEAGLAEIGSKK